MDMDMDMDMSSLPWLDSPVMLHSSRADTCKLTAEQCTFRHGHWRYWYQADHVYGLNTIYFCIAMVAIFIIGNVLSRFVPASSKSNGLWRRAESALRFVSYRSYNIRSLGWWSPPLGIIVLGIAAAVFFFGMTLGPQPYYWPNTATVSFGSSPPLATRAGWMALGIMPFTIALAAKANWISLVTGIPHEKLQVFHRWSAYIMFVLALVHTFPFIVYNIQKGDMMEEYMTSLVYWTGIACIIPQAWLTIMSFGPIRERFYELFRLTHYAAAWLFVIFFFFHCDFRLSSWDYFIATGVLYLSSLLYSQIRTYFAYGFTHRATLTPLPSGVLKVTIPAHPKLKWTPGQHVFVRFLVMKWISEFHCFETHPFSICSAPPTSKADGPAELVLYITPVSGLTRLLSNLATKMPGITVPVMLEGPYGGLKESTFARFDKGLIIAGGAGAGFTLPLIEDILRRCKCGDGCKCSNKTENNDTPVHNVTQLHVIVVTRSRQSLDWYSAEIDHLLSSYPSVSKDVLKVSLYLTRDDGGSLHDGEGDAKQPPQSVVDADTIAIGEKERAIESSAESSQRSTSAATYRSGRPDIAACVREATAAQGTKVGIAVCGPAHLLFDTRNAAAEAQQRVMKGQGAAEVYLHSEHFGW